MPIARSHSMWAVAPISPTLPLPVEKRPIRSRSIISLSPEDLKKGGRKLLKRNRSSVPCGTLFTPPPCLRGDMDAVDNEGKSLIFYAARYGQTDTAEQLIEAGCDLTQKDNHGNTPLHEAIASGNMEVAEAMLEKGEANVNIEGKHGETPLLLAVSRGQVDMVKMLHKHGADVNKSDLCGCTPVYKALHKGWVDIADFLLVNQCDVNKTTANGKTCLYAAAHNNKIRCQPVVKHLFKADYDFRKDADWINEEGCPISSDVDPNMNRKILERAGLKQSSKKSNFLRNGRRKFVKTLRSLSRTSESSSNSSVESS